MAVRYDARHRPWHGDQGAHDARVSDHMVSHAESTLSAGMGSCEKVCDGGCAPGSAPRRGIRDTPYGWGGDLQRRCME